MVNNRILRENAKNQLGGKLLEQPWLMVAVAFLIGSAVISAAGTMGLGIGALIVTGPLLYGLNRICIKTVCGSKNVELEDMIAGFKECFAQSLVLSLVTALYTFLWSLLFVIPGIVKFYSYAMAPYILHDDPSRDGQYCLEESKKMMQGNKWQLFCLDFSFIGWYIVGSFCLGIGVFWANAYHYVARANFYMALKAKNEPPKTESSDFEPADPFNN